MTRKFSIRELRGLHAVAVACAAGTPIRKARRTVREDLVAQRADAATDVGLVEFVAGRLSCWSEPSEFGWQIAEARGWAKRPEGKPADHPTWQRFTGRLPAGVSDAG